MRICGGNGGKASRTSNIWEIGKSNNILRSRHPAIFVSTFIYSNTAVGKYYGIGHVEHMFLEYSTYSRFEKRTFVRALFVVNRK
jgi:hypothetical protein